MRPNGVLSQLVEEDRELDVLFVGQQHRIIVQFNLHSFDVVLKDSLEASSLRWIRHLAHQSLGVKWNPVFLQHVLDKWIILLAAQSGLHDSEHVKSLDLDDYFPH